MFAELDPGSFRDRGSRVYTANGRILRALDTQALADWRALRASPLLAELLGEGLLVATTETDDRAAPIGTLHDGVAGVLEHGVIPFVSYPYEWPFGMLRDAALLQLELLRRALEGGLTLKDASPYNVQWRGAKPVFVDIGSFEPVRPGEPWAAYLQFCMLFLYPLLLQAWKDVPFQPLLRGRLSGIPPQDCRNMLSIRDLLRRGALTHVALHARLERSYEHRDADLGRELARAGFNENLILANVKGLERIISGLRWRRSRSAWSRYEATTTYSADDAVRKERFVVAATMSQRPRLVWDLGCNEGRHARIAARYADYVVAMDSDAFVVDRLYAQLAGEGHSTILPLTVDLVDASPGLGWLGRERRPLLERGRPDLVLCLALVHHMSISGNVPVADIVDWLADLGARLVIEFPTPDDPMVSRLLGRKGPTAHPDYTLDSFERSLRTRFDVESSEMLAAGTRVLYLARPKRR